MERLWREFLQNGPRAVLRWRAHKKLQVPLWDGVDVVASRARNLFADIPPEALAAPEGASEREILLHALNVIYYVVMLAYFFQSRKKISKKWL